MPPNTIRRETLHILNRPAHFHVGGNGPQTVLLLHGGWGDAAMHWSRVWHRLSLHFHVVAPDLPGLGDVTQPGRACLAAYVTWLEALLDALDVAHVICVGNSFGASLAWSFAGRAPERCQALVMVDGFALPRTPAPLLWLGRNRLGRAMVRTLVNLVSFTPRLLPRAFADPRHAPPEVRESLQDAPTKRLETFVACMLAGDGPPAPLAPILVLWGEMDRLPGTRLDVGKKLAASLPGARFVSLAQAGHFPQLERPEEFVHAIEAFLHGMRHL